MTPRSPALDEQSILLSALPPTRAQKRLAADVAIVLFAAFVLWAWLIETMLLSTTPYRYSLVWYGGRAFGIRSKRRAGP